MNTRKETLSSTLWDFAKVRKLFGLFSFCWFLTRFWSWDVQTLGRPASSFRSLCFESFFWKSPRVRRTRKEVRRGETHPKILVLGTLFVSLIGLPGAFVLAYVPLVLELINSLQHHRLTQLSSFQRWILPPHPLPSVVSSKVESFVFLWFSGKMTKDNAGGTFWCGYG